MQSMTSFLDYVIYGIRRAYDAGASEFLCVSVLNIPIQTHSKCLYSLQSFILPTADTFSVKTADKNT